VALLDGESRSVEKVVVVVRLLPMPMLLQVQRPRAAGDRLSRQSAQK
jgi:hypothetical protein